MSEPRFSFGDLRQLLQAPPDRGAWNTLCKMAQHWDPQDWVQRAGPYALQHLERWPDSLRTAPLPWLESMRSGALPQGIELLRVMIVYPSMALEQLPQQLDLGSMTQMTLSQAESMDLGALATWPAMASLEQLSVQTRSHDEAMNTQLLTHLERLTPALHSLSLQLRKLSVAHARAIAQYAHTRQLRALGLNDNALDHTHAWALGPHLESLQKLDLGNNPLGTMGLVALVQDRARSWSICHLDSAEMGPQAPGLLAEHLQSLQYVDLDFSDLNGAWEVLEDHHTLPWQALSLRSARLHYDDLYALSRAQSLPPLRHLNLSLNNLSDRRWGAALASAYITPQLETLGLDHTYMDHQGLHQFCQRLGPNHLTRLSLRSAGLDDRCVEWLAQAPHLGGLQLLSLEGNTITGRGWRALADSPEMSPQVRERARRYLL